MATMNIQGLNLPKQLDQMTLEIMRFDINRHSLLAISQLQDDNSRCINAIKEQLLKKNFGNLLGIPGLWETSASSNP